jgi:hypothetical protein
LGTGVVDAYLKHGKTALQFGRAAFCTFPGAELGLQSSIDFEGKTGFRSFGRAGKPVPMILEGVAT